MSMSGIMPPKPMKVGDVFSSKSISIETTRTIAASMVRGRIRGRTAERGAGRARVIACASSIPTCSPRRIQWIALGNEVSSGVELEDWTGGGDPVPGVMLLVSVPLEEADEPVRPDLTDRDDDVPRGSEAHHFIGTHPAAVQVTRPAEMAPGVREMVEALAREHEDRHRLPLASADEVDGGHALDWAVSRPDQAKHSGHSAKWAMTWSWRSGSHWLVRL